MERLARAALFIERYGISLLFLYFAWRQIGPTRADFAQWRGGSPTAFPSLANHLLVLSLQLATGTALLINRAPLHPPQRWNEIAVPLIGTFYYLVYNFASTLPPPFSHPLVSAELQGPLAGGALLLSSIGYTIAVWGALYLGRSFAVLVAVREVVAEGPYRFVRHPIYCGYVLHLVSLFLSRPTLGMATLLIVHLCILVWRARIEEASLREHSAAYREYARKTGFLLPGWP